MEILREFENSRIPRVRAVQYMESHLAERAYSTTIATSTGGRTIDADEKFNSDKTPSVDMNVNEHMKECRDGPSDEYLKWLYNGI